jgi:hypothetical protein
VQRKGISRTLTLAPISANPDSMFFAFIYFDAWFASKSNRAKYEVQLRAWADSEDSVWSVALSKEQLALISENGSHGTSFPFNSCFGLRGFRVKVLFRAHFPWITMKSST